MQIVKDIYLDFYQSEPVLVTAKEGDVGRFLHVTLLDNGNIFPVPSGSTVTFSRDDVWNGCTVNDDGTIMAPITADMRPGRVPAQIEVSSGNDHLSSWNFILDVQNSARNDSAIEGNNDFSAIQTLLDQVQDAIDNTNTAIANVNAAIANMGQNFASLANTQNITQLATNAKTLVGGINELNSNISDVSILNQVVSDRKLEFDINIGVVYNNSVGEYIVCGNCDNMNIFSAVILYSYEVKIIGYVSGNMYTNSEMTADYNNGLIHVTMSADRITSEMNFNLKCVKITPLR